MTITHLSVQTPVPANTLESIGRLGAHWQHVRLALCFGQLATEHDPHLSVQFILQGAQLPIFSVQISSTICQGIHLLPILVFQAISLPVQRRQASQNMEAISPANLIHALTYAT